MKAGYEARLRMKREKEREKEEKDARLRQEEEERDHNLEGWAGKLRREHDVSWIYVEDMVMSLHNDFPHRIYLQN